MATTKIKLNKKIANDFEDFWDFWMSLLKYAETCLGLDEEGNKNELPIPNKMMVTAYAAHIWFSNKNKKGTK